ncbi:MAG TPA: sulfotransferase, partial [Sphingomonadales bacterium]|nr:sulfotransferase [Sphingomonadales bacterium]
YKVFFSMRNFYAELFKELALQEPAAVDLDAHILGVYARMMDLLAEDTVSLPENQFVELSYARLVEAPVAAIAEIYRALKIPGFDRDIGRFTAYLDSVQNFRKNVYSYPEEDLAKVEAGLSRFIGKWGYRWPGEGE